MWSAARARSSGANLRTGLGYRGQFSRMAWGRPSAGAPFHSGGTLVSSKLSSVTSWPRAASPLEISKTLRTTPPWTRVISER